MRPDHKDQSCLWDMLDAALAIEEFVCGTSYEGYLSNRMMRSAVERNLEIIGEAARRVSEETRQAHPDIPWHSIVGQRNVLVHEYGEVVNEAIWAVATRRIPELIARLRAIQPNASEMT